MSNKDSYWFRHDSTAGRGLRMRKMAHIYGHWGKGIYWDVIEILRDQANYCFDSDDSSLQMLADLIGCKDEIRFINWFKDCEKIGLFVIQNNRFFSEVLCENMAFWEKQKTNGSKGGRPEKTQTETQIKPKPKPKRKHNSTVHNNTYKYVKPTLDEFLSFCKTINEINFEEYKFSLESKYETWDSAGWKDGNDSEIKNWKTKIKNTIPYMKPMKKQNVGYQPLSGIA